MSERFTDAHNLISDYVIGNEAEQSGYTFLNSTSEFVQSLNELIEFTGDRHTEAYSYLSQQ